MGRFARMLLGLFLSAGGGLAPLAAQVGTEASIVGVVTDASGAVVPGAQITVKNLETGLQKTAVTDEFGNFTVLALPRGPYSVSVSARGFKTWTLEKTELIVGERKRLSPVLEIGEVSEQVTVFSTTELIQTEKSSVTAVVQEKQIRDLPLNGRNVIQLVSLAPGMRYLGKGGPEQGSTVQGLGHRTDQTEFQLDGVTANSGMDEVGICIPNVDAIAEFNVESSSFSAEHGRMPVQVLMATKSGTNEFHGTLWEFVRNEKLDAFYTFAKLPGARKPKLARNQFGGTIGGPIIKDRTHFFGSYEGTTIRQESVYNSTVVSPAMMNGDFSALTKVIKDPAAGQPFPGNLIPPNRISSASKFFFPYILLPNSPDGRYRASAPNPTTSHEWTGRIDQQVTSQHRIYGRWITYKRTAQPPHYRPEVYQRQDHLQHSISANYTYAVNPTTLFTLSASYLYSSYVFTSPVAGKENLAEKAGIQGIVTAGREAFIGLPTVSFTGYTGFSAPWGVPGRLWFNAEDGKASVNLIRAGHTLNFGYQLNLRNTLGRHGSHSVRGNFTFNGQYSGDGFADYLLGLVASTMRNYPIDTFGMSDCPYSGLYAQDFWRVRRNLTLNLGVRYDYWHRRAFVNGGGATFDPRIGKGLAAEDKSGKVNLGAQPTAKYLAEATKDFWVPASQASVPPGLFQATGMITPRIGIAWRPLGKNDLVFRAGYGLFASGLRGNAVASTIVGLPFWAIEQRIFSPSMLQRWETVWPIDPSAWQTPSFSEAVDWKLRPNKAHEFNFSVQKGLPFHSAITLSYVGTRGYDLIQRIAVNEVPPGRYTDLQAAKPYPKLGPIYIFQNTITRGGESWYNALQLKLERRFTEGLSYTLAYAFSKNLGDHIGGGVYSTLVPPFAPSGYLRGRLDIDRTHILAFNAIYELPFGRGRKYGSRLHPAVNVVVGGWQLSGIYTFTSGVPLSFDVPGATLGNGWGTRANLVGNIRVPNPGPDGWFNPAGLAAPPLYTWGNSGRGIMDGPGAHSVDTALMKNFFLTESRYFQFRWEMFNMPNHVNYGDPVTTVGLATTGKIYSAGPARSMQLGLKLIF